MRCRNLLLSSQLRRRRVPLVLEQQQRRWIYSREKPRKKKHGKGDSGDPSKGSSSEFRAVEGSLDDDRRRNRLATILALALGGTAASYAYSDPQVAKHWDHWINSLIQFVVPGEPLASLIKEETDEMEKIPWFRRPQKAVVSPLQKAALFLTVYLDPKADLKACASVAARFSENHQNDEDVAIAVGYNENLWREISRDVPAGAQLHPFEYRPLKCHGEGKKKGKVVLPATKGEIFVHVKADDRGKCVELAQELLEAFPPHSIYDAEDIYGYDYKDGKDLMEFKLHGNPGSVAKRIETATISSSGGSYALVQLWRHLVYDFKDLSNEQQNQVIGKSKQTGEYLCQVDLQNHPELLAEAMQSGLPESSHIARMIGVDRDGKRLGIVRQSMPTGSWAPGPIPEDNTQESGIVYLAYAQDPLIFTYMLQRMVGFPIRGNSRESRPADSILKYNECLRGQFFYMPSQEQIRALTQ